MPAGDSRLLSAPYAATHSPHQQASSVKLNGGGGRSQGLLLPAVVAVTPSPKTLTHALLTEQQQQPAAGQQQPRKSLHLQQWEAEQINYQEQRLRQQQLQALPRRSQQLCSPAVAPPPQQRQHRQRERQQSWQPLVQSASVTARYPVRTTQSLLLSVTSEV